MWTSALTFTLAPDDEVYVIGTWADSESIIPTLQDVCGQPSEAAFDCFILQTADVWKIGFWSDEGVIYIQGWWLLIDIDYDFVAWLGGIFPGLPVASRYLVQSGPNFLFHLPISVYEWSNEKLNLCNCISVNHLLTCMQQKTKDNWKPCLQIFTYFYADMYLTSYMMDKMDIETNKEPVRHREWKRPI